MKKLKVKFGILLLFVIKLYPQNKECVVKYHTSDNVSVSKDTISEYEYEKDSINFRNHQNVKLSFYNNKLFLNNKKIYRFKRVDYYYYIADLKKDNKEYIYIYPHYKNRAGPYIWYELGILIEINEKEIIVKNKIDYFERFEICNVIDFDKYIIIKKIFYKQ